MGFHGKDLRNGRCSIQGQIYFVTTITHQRQPFFQQWTGASAVAWELHQLASTDVLAWVLMPDHLHCLVQLNSNSLSGFMQQLKSLTGISLNKALKRTGKVWQSGFHDHALRRDEDLRAAARYLVANPLRAGLVRSLRDYPFWNAVWL
ncbi:transposase [Pseudomonas sp. 21]|uniref:REP-associated tyrosine transposase n=1 Tax=unclassified Pseudomonas TaxID=196821 RepID=UPI0005EADDB0|nr:MULTISPECIES: transposase [unclassified Pseudomonas]KJK01580.1 transposase [Pseudomonas sp. 21]MBV7582224.1 transposase [Pseudomonas sp. PDM33]